MSEQRLERVGSAIRNGGFAFSKHAEKVEDLGFEAAGGAGADAFPIRPDSG